MKKLLSLMLLLILLQIAYYFLSMEQIVNEGHYSYNLMSIISVLILLGIYLKRTLYTMKFGPGHNFQKLGIALIIIFMLYSFFFFFSVMGSLGTGILYFARYNLRVPLFNNPKPLLLWKYHLITYQYLLFILNSFVVIIKSNNEKYQRHMKFLYLILSFIVLLHYYYLSTLIYTYFIFQFLLLFKWLFIGSSFPLFIMYVVNSTNMLVYYSD